MINNKIRMRIVMIVVTTTAAAGANVPSTVSVSVGGRALCAEESSDVMGAILVARLCFWNGNGFLAVIEATASEEAGVLA
jgi:hypothetical protein